MEEIYSLFPILKTRRRQLAGTLSGGEQQMLAIGEVSWRIPSSCSSTSPRSARSDDRRDDRRDHQGDQRPGVTILLVEQNVNVALHSPTAGTYSNWARSRCKAPGGVVNNEDVKKAYLGL